MLRADLVLSNARIYGVERIDVRLGEVFDVLLYGVDHSPHWFADNDPVLSIDTTPSGMSAQITATQTGMSIIEWHVRGTKIGSLIVKVYAEEAASLNPTAGEPEPK